MREQLIAELAVMVEARHVLHRCEELMLYEYDGSALDQAMPDLVVAPADTAEVAACLRAASSHGVPIVTRSTRTGLAGGSVADQRGRVIATSRMDRVLSIDAGCARGDCATRGGE